MAHPISGLSTTTILLVASLLTGCAKKTGSADVARTPEDSREPSTSSEGSSAGERDNALSSNNPLLKDVFFNFDDHSLSAEARSTLSQNASLLREMAGLHATIEGHCDERGTVEYNLALGQRRADAARSYLIDLGIDSGRLKSISYGEERPFLDGHDESSWSQNRRAHFVVVNN
jgi:peptidoglycan-associated lipoprotein